MPLICYFPFKSFKLLSGSRCCSNSIITVSFSVSTFMLYCIVDVTSISMFVSVNFSSLTTLSFFSSSNNLLLLIEHELILNEQNWVFCHKPQQLDHRPVFRNHVLVLHEVVLEE